LRDKDKLIDDCDVSSCFVADRDAMYQPAAAPVVQFNQAPPQQGPVIQIMPQQPQMPAYPPPPMMMAPAPAPPPPKKDENRETYIRAYLPV